MVFTPLLIVFALTICAHGYSDVQPQQVHLSLGGNPTEMMVTWVTMDATVGNATVEFGESSEFGFSESRTGSSSKFTDGGSEKRSMYIHRVLLDGLVPGDRYLYHVGSTDSWSDIFELVAIRNDSAFSPRIAVFGDLGTVNGQSIPRLQQEVIRRNFDAILHVGDFAYDLDTDNARVGDLFMRQIEPVAAYAPYQTCVGNHENAYNFSNYDNRFSMVNQADGTINNMFYSFNIGPAHIIALSTEYYFYIEYGWKQIENQFKWLQKDLKEATKPENRKLRPWIITIGHRPMYCSTDDRDDCKYADSIIRTGFPVTHDYALEDLLHKYGVDLAFWGHEHLYERMWPVYDGQVLNGTEQAYTDPPATVHITTGSAGCQERLDPFVKEPLAWSAKRISDYGYTHMHIINSTHLDLEQISDDQGGKVVDKVTLIRNTHGPFRSRKRA
ncbi:Purple acid phosphatase 21 [Halotydeus destructor]|nr:Purple acid phosphatase 21 [Halotydeus destructor]